MAALLQNMQRYCLPIVMIGSLTGLLALIPRIGWLLGLSVLVLAWRYARRSHFLPDLLLMLAVWMLVRELALQVSMTS